MTRSLLLLVLFALSLGLPVPAAAADPVRASRVPEGAVVVVDGRIDEEVWATAPVVDGFVGISPTEGFEPAGETTVRILYDDRRIYFAWRCRFDEQTRVRAYFSDREDINRDDQVAIILDPFGDGRRAYHFWLNALGVQQDMVVTLEGTYNWAWDTVFSSFGRIVEGGYDLEVAIPYRSLRFDPASGRPWRILLKRKFTALDQYAAYPFVKRDDGNELLQFAELLMDPPKTSGVGIELLPSVVGRTGWDRLDPDDEDLTHRGFTFPGTVDPSFGFKWQTTPSLTLDATLNPDFSQIEADPDQIDNNLRFALLLPEQRPFFLEGTELYDRHLLHTRSIRDPVYGVKFSGKAGRVGIGVLHALDETPASTFVGERATPGFSADEMEGALAFNTLGGATIDLGRRSSVSVYYADKEVVRPVDGEEGALEHTALYRAGNARLRWGVDDHTTVEVSGALSHTGEADGDRLTGGRFTAQLGRETRTQGYGVEASLVTPDYRAEMGFLTAPDRGGIGGWLGRRLEPTNGPVQWVDLVANAKSRFEGFDSRVRPSSGHAAARATVRLPGITDVSVNALLWDLFFADRTFQGARTSFTLRNVGLEFLSVRIHGSFGDDVRFSDATPTVAGSIEGRIGVRVLRRLNLSFSAQINRLGRRGETVDQLTLYRVHAVAGFTRWLSLRVIAQGRRSAVFSADGALEDTSGGLRLSALLRIEPSPGTAVFIGWGQELLSSEGKGLKTDSIDLYAKASVLIRL